MGFSIERGIRLMEIALVLAVVLMLAKMVLTFFNADQQFLVPAKPANTAQLLDLQSNQIDTSVLATFDIFRRTNSVLVQEPIVEQAPETSLNLKIFGMRADRTGESSSAIIQTPDLKQAAYFVGDEIIPGVILKSVDIDFVILERDDGTQERLSRQGRSGDDKSSLSLLTPTTLAFSAGGMLEDLRFFPHREGRQTIGFKIRARRGGELKKYGFERDDIITAINGVDLTQNQINLPNMWKTFRQSRFASIQIIRNDQPMTLEVNLQ